MVIYWIFETRQTWSICQFRFINNWLLNGLAWLFLSFGPILGRT